MFHAGHTGRSIFLLTIAALSSGCSRQPSETTEQATSLETAAPAVETSQVAPPSAAAPASQQPSSVSSKSAEKQDSEPANPSQSAAQAKQEMAPEAMPPGGAKNSESPANQVSVATVANRSDVPPIALAAEKFFKSYCHRCHGEGGTNEGGLNYILRYDKLVAGDQYIIEGNCENSPLWQRIASGEMPPDGEVPRPNVTETESLKKWIEGGAPAFSKEAERPFISNEQIVARIAAHLKSLSEYDRKFHRYFTFTHFYNSGVSNDELSTYRLALSKLLNSLSWSRELVMPVFIDEEKTIATIDERSLKWSPRAWDAISASNPFAVFLPSSADADFIAEATAEKIPYVRGDWFITAASRPPLYHEVLEIPGSEIELEQLLRVDASLNIRQGTVMRAGFVKSGVSQNNRVIERHESTYGAYWKSYDFGGNVGPQNIIEHPLGPGRSDGTFKHDGGELIFSLPNGLQGYMLVKSTGERIDEGPISIVRDLSSLGPAVVNGVSCMSCHYAGIIPKADEIRTIVEKSRESYPLIDDILRIYPPREALDKAIDEDRTRFETAVKKLGISRLTRSNEPIVSTVIRFTDDLDLPIVAAELGITKARLQELLKGDSALSREVGSLNIEGGTIKRVLMIRSFGSLVKSAETGVHIAADEVKVAALARVVEPAVPQAEIPIPEEPAVRKPDRYLDLPPLPKRTESAVESVMIDALPAIGRYALDIFGLEELSQGRLQVEHPKGHDDALDIFYVAQPDARSQTTQRKSEIPKAAQASSPPPSTPDRVRLARFWVAEGALRFSWERPTVDPRKRQTVADYQDLVRDGLLKFNANQAETDQYIALRTVVTLEAQEVKGPLNGREKLLMRFTTPNGARRGIQLDNFRIHTLQSTCNSVELPSHPKEFARCQISDYAESGLYIEIMELGGLKLNVDTVPSFQAGIKFVQAKQSQIANLEQDLARHQANRAAGESSYSAAQSERDPVIRSTLVGQAQDTIRNAENNISQTMALGTKAQNELQAAGPALEKLKKVADAVSGGVVSGTVYRMLDGVRIDLVVIEPPHSAAFQMSNTPAEKATSSKPTATPKTRGRKKP